MKKILISHPISPQRLEELNQHFEVHCIKSIEHRYEEVSEMIPEFNALLAVVVDVDSEMIEKAPQLEIISKYGVGYDNIDVKAATKKNIVVANTPQTVTTATADMTMGLMLDVMRKISWTDRQLRAGQISDWGSRDLIGNSVFGKKLGIIGMGRIGRAVAKRAKAFGMTIYYHNRNRLEATIEKELNANYLSLNEILDISDVLSLNCPLTPETYHIIDAPQLNIMKEGAYIINTARGNVINHAALIKALEEGKIAGAGLDVFPEEPKIPQPLLTMKNVVLTPHIGTGTVEARQEMFAEAFGNIVSFFTGNGQFSRVN